MNDKEQAAIQQALDALEEYRDTQMIKAPRRAITALREALDPELQFIRDWNEGKVRRVSDGKVMGVAEQAEQEPVCCETYGCAKPCPKYYAGPVRTKDLTDDDIFKTNKTELPDCQDLVDFARAVIAADREKNK